MILSSPLNPFEKLFLEAPLVGTIDFKLGRETFSLPISRAKNSLAELLPQPEPVEEVMAIFPFEPSASSLEQDAKLFIQEEDDSGETLEIPTDERPSQPSIELKPLPSSLRYAFCRRYLAPPFVYRKRMVRVAFPLDYSPQGLSIRGSTKNYLRFSI